MQIAAIRRSSVFKYGIASFMPRGLAVLNSLLLLPLGIEKLGSAQYGVWIVATQIPSLVVSPDLGLGQGIINEMVGVQRKFGDLRSEQTRLFGLTKLFLLIAAGWMLLGTAASAIYAVTNSSSTLNKSELFLALVVALASFTAGIPATLWTRTQLAQERGHVSVLWEGAGKLLSLVTCFVVLVYRPSLLGLVVAFVLPTTITLWCNAIIYVRSEFGGSRPWSVPSLGEAFSANRKVFRVGGYFVIMQICFLAATALDPYLINTILSSTSVTAWTVWKRPFALLPLAVSLFSTALWPVFARLHAQGQSARLRRITISVTVFAFVAAALVGITIIALRTPIYGFLGREKFDPRLVDLAWIGLLAATSTAVLVVNNYLNAIQKIRTQALILTISTIVIFFSKTIALTFGGLDAYFAAASVSYVCFTAIPIFFLAWRYLFKGSR